MDTPTNMQVVGAQMENVENLRALLEPILGAVPAVNLRLEIVMDNTRTVYTVNDSEISIQEEPSGKIVAQGDWALATAAISGLETSAASQP